MSLILQLKRVDAFYGSHQVLHGLDIEVATGPDREK